MNAPQVIPMIDRIPPQNLEAEMALLGSILVDREMMTTVSEIVQPTDFYASLHESIYSALYSLYERGEPLDKITLAEELKQRGMLDRVGGLAYLGSLMDTVPTAASAEYYAKIVREKSSLRGLIHAGTQITKLGYENEEDVEAALDSSEQIIYDVGNRSDRGKFSLVSGLLLDTFYKLEQRHAQRGDRTGVTSGFRDIDEYTAGFQPGNLIILAARPAMGKTSMALNMAVAAAKEEKKPVAVFSLEMTKQELVERLISSESRLDASNLRKGAIKNEEWEKISHSMGVLHDLPLYLDDSGTVTITEIRSRCRRLKSKSGLAAIFIDYLQLVRPSTIGKVVNRNEELSEICRTLKATAKDLEVPIIALAQLNRAVETRQDKRPMLSDLRDCLAADALVTNAETGERATIAEIVERGLRFNVWALDDRLQLVQRPIVDAWKVGEKQVHRVTTKSGRTIRCTDGHRFRTVAGWSELKNLSIGSAIAVPCVQSSRADSTCDGHSDVREQNRIAGADSKSTMVAERSNVGLLGGLNSSAIAWDPIVSIEAEGVESVYDLTVENLHNFCVNDIVTHNSGAIEQEADLVTFLYRDEYYHKESTPDPGLTEFIIAKHRSGRTGMIKLRFEQEHTLFRPYADETHYPAP